MNLKPTRLRPAVTTALGTTFTTSVGTSSKASVSSARDALGRHLATCRACENHLFRIRCVLEAVDRFATPRLVTTVVLFAAALAMLNALS